MTKHRYLERYPVSPDSEKLIVGTIHPDNYQEFQVKFFYGNVGSIWKILSEAFPLELKNPNDLNDILSFLKGKKISVSDTIIECHRTTTSALDQDLIPIKFNHKIIEDIRNSNIKEVLFTSGFGKNNAFRLFYTDILGLKITGEIRKNREVMLNKEVFGRPVKLTILYSPSGSANIGISKTSLYLANKDKYKNSPRPVQDFKVDYYREKFS